MHIYFHILGLNIPSYGLMIAPGVVLANIIVAILIHFTKQSFDELLVLEGYGLLGGFLGAKGLYLLVSFREIEWNRFFEPGYFNEVMQSGFVFYGGFILGVAFVLLAGKIHHIPICPFLENFAFLIPFAHGFGRLGCYLAGCCYGRPYEGLGAVVFPEESVAPAGISLFPIQLVEMCCLFAISFAMFLVRYVWKKDFVPELYLVLYGITRFVLEYFRYDEERGAFLWFSTSQWISIGMLVVAFIFCVMKRRKTRGKSRG